MNRLEQIAKEISALVVEQADPATSEDRKWEIGEEIERLENEQESLYRYYDKGERWQDVPELREDSHLEAAYEDRYSGDDFSFNGEE